MSQEGADHLDLLIQEDAADAPSAELLEAMLQAATAATVDHEPGVRDRLREMATWQRILTASGLMLLVSLSFAIITGLRTDLDPDGWLRFFEAAGLTVLCSVGGVAFSLRAAHRRPLGAISWIGSIQLVLLPFFFAVVPGLWPGFPTPAEMIPMAHIGCTGMGLVGSLPAALLVLVFERSDRPPAWRLLSTAGAAGLAGYAFQNLHCPFNDPFHLLVSHASYGILVAGVLIGVRWIRELTRR